MATRETALAIPKYLLYQVRNPGDPMRDHEILCFADKLRCPRKNILVHDVISGRPQKRLLDQVDAVLVGGSGDYSVAAGGDWLPMAMDEFRDLYETGKPTFASCWGFQAFAQALGGTVVTDLQRAELGTHSFQLTEAGKADPVFGPLGSPFEAQIGHQDIVDRLPEGALLLCSSNRVVNEAFSFPDKPIYGTQFHPELELQDLITRVHAYPEYVLKITGLPMDEFLATCRETPETPRLLRRFVEHVLES
jgi:GMP synthase (glutamine-hydrolysing)